MKKLFSLIIVLFCVQFLVTAQEEPTCFKIIEKESNTIFIGLSNKKVWTDQEVRNIYAQYKLDNMDEKSRIWDNSFTAEELEKVSQTFRDSYDYSIAYGSYIEDWHDYGILATFYLGKDENGKYLFKIFEIGTVL
ncbi:hypothetical protein [Treponema sp. Marseille-Q3903]|uniref:hypothetical protein n=1 Tax=Treponema sp. Marseille-Q3903 TaxID=2766703 RepID=UPI00165250DD|nr:hypothetical protein [Treponema sp. Marseille-Q3903]MBC6713750.1 hypothetical protein [Treponema sp. Marseille-Q3903]